MAEGEVKISGLPLGATLNGSEKLEAVQDYENVQISVDQILDYVTNNIPATGRTIANLENVNLKDELPNVLDWLNDKLANNTSAQTVAIKHISGDYVVKNIPGTSATTTIVFDPSTYPSDEGVGYLIRLFVGGNEIFSGHENAGWATIEAWMDYVKVKYEFWGYVVVIDGLNMHLTGADGLYANINDLINEVETRDDNANSYISSLSSSPAFSGGVNAKTTSFDVQLNGESISDISGQAISNSIQLLNSTKVISASIRQSILSSIGDWAIPVITGTQDDFIISIFILGDPI